MQVSFLKRIQFFLLGALGSVLFFIPFWGGVVFSFALTKLLKKSEKLGSFKGVLFFFLWGFFVAPLSWVSNALWVEISVFWWLIPFALVGLPALVAAVYTLVLAVLPWRFFDKGWTRGVAFALSWGVAEWCSSWVLTGFPWALVGYSWQNLPLLQSVAFFKIYGLSVVTILFWAIPYVWRKDKSWVYPVLLLGIMGALYVGGIYRLRQHPVVFTDISVKIVQPNTAQLLKMEPSAQYALFEQLVHLSQKGKKTDLVLWPEAPVQLDFERNQWVKKKLQDFLQPHQILITGADRFAPDHKIFNSLFVLNSTGKVVGRYDKHHRVPFGEYIPFRTFLTALFGDNRFRKLTAGLGDFSEGGGPQTVVLPKSFPAVSPVICFEMAFPGSVLKKNGHPEPQWMVHLTNDAWFGDSIGPRQHLHLARVRAIEEGLPVIRVANTGISAVIDGCGRLLSHMPLDTQGVQDVWLPAPVQGIKK